MVEIPELKKLATFVFSIRVSFNKIYISSTTLASILFLNGVITHCYKEWHTVCSYTTHSLC